MSDMGSEIHRLQATEDVKLVAEQTTTTPTVHSQEYEQRRRFKVEEAYRLMALFPGEKWELIEGEIISKMGENPPHGYVLQVLIPTLSALFPERVRIQSAMTLP